MATRNFTLSAVSKLPISHQRLMCFDCMYHLRCQLLESVFIQPQPNSTIYGPEGDIFQYPTQITVLNIEGNYVDLGIYTHPSLLVRRGPMPNRHWRKDWKKACSHWESSAVEPTDKLELLHLVDECHRLVSLHSFCYDALEELLQTEDGDNSAYTLNGVHQLLNMLRKWDKAFHKKLNKLHESQHKILPPPQKTKN